MNKENWTDIYAKTPLRKMVALYDYDPQELSPNVDAEVELKFKTGDIIFVYGEMDDDGFYLAELRNQRGLVPSNFLTDATTTEAKQQVQQVQQQQIQQQQQLQPQPQPKSKLINLSGASGPPPPPRDMRGKFNLFAKNSFKE